MQHQLNATKSTNHFPHLRNSYYIYMHWHEFPIPWNIFEAPPFDLGLAIYLGKVLQEMEKCLNVEDLVFYITWDELDELPTHGDNVVVIILGDEWYRIPKYVNKVGAIFKCVGTNAILGCNPIYKPSHLNLLTLIQYLRILLVGIPGLLNYFWYQIKDIFTGQNSIAPIYDIPLGYANSQELSIKPIEKRTFDAYFSGSIAHINYPKWSIKGLIGTPKMLARQTMVSKLSAIQANNPQLNIELAITGDFYSSFNAQAVSNQAEQPEIHSYPEAMMNTKICLVPRGTSFETTRLFEAMRYGCIVITEALPSRWYLDGAPIIQINDWDELEQVLKNLYARPQLMQELHQESLRWWESKCSEARVGGYLANNINAKHRVSMLKLSPIVSAQVSQVQIQEQDS
jgi:hypothetical protein